MDETMTSARPRETVASRAATLFQEQRLSIFRKTDHLFAWLMLFQWVAAIASAFWISPRTWAGQYSQVHPHIWAAVFLGGVITLFPVALAWFRNGEASTRYTIAASQMLMSALLIHLTGGRIETHFHIFGSLAFLAFYRDWIVFIPATIVVAADHLLRGIYWPQSVFGVLTPSPWRWVEHAGWVIFEDIFLIRSCLQSVAEMKNIAMQRAEREAANEEALRKSEERYALAARGANDGLWDWNLLDNVVYFSPRWKSMLGYEDGEIGSSPEEWVDRIHQVDRERVTNEIASHQRGLTPHFESENRVQHKDGTFRWMLSRGVAVHDASGRACRMAGSQTDITAGKVADALTGLPNRLLFVDRLGRLLEHTRRHHDYLFAVMFLDLDGFKMINDSLGHLAGDRLLIEVAHRLENHLRTSDTVTRVDKLFTLARLGGDEFTVLLDQLENPAAATLVAERLMEALTAPFVLDGKEVFISVSIGIALSSAGYENPEDLLRDADTAMYRAKSMGKARYEVFDAGMRASVVARLQLETDLRHGLERGEFRNFYQPIVSLSTGEIVGFEALSRWQHPKMGLLAPVEFIPVAEETGLIRELGWWNLQEACRQISVWNTQRGPGRALTISVNLSVKQFLEPNLVGQIEKLLRDLEIPPETLKLEITESTVIADPTTAVRMLLQIKALGVHIAIDDFGTGHSSLSYLQRLPLDTLKIDRSFTKGMGQEEESTEIVRTILSMTNNLQLNVIAEGVETAEQAAMLRELQCGYAQGYYFSKPIAAADAEALLEQKPKWFAPRLVTPVSA